MVLPTRDGLSPDSDAMDGQRLFFRTRGGPVYGWGNIFRLSSFASWCRDRGHTDLTFLVEGPREVEEYLRRQGFEVVPLAEDLSVAEEDAVLETMEPCDVLFLEMLDVPLDRQAMLARHGESLVVFDDLCDHPYVADVVVCGQWLPNYSNRDLSLASTRFLEGPEYFLSRPEFLPYRDQSRQHRKQIEHVLVTLGGGGYDVGFLKAAMALSRWRPEVAATFVLGYADHGSLAERIRGVLPHAEILGGVDDLEQRFWNTDFAIVSAGYSKLEAAITGTPCAMMSVQWHQIPLAEEFSRKTEVPHAGYMSYVEVDALVSLMQQWEAQEQRQALAERMAGSVDGRGFERVYDAVFAAQPVGS